MNYEEEIVLRDGSRYILGAGPNSEVVSDPTIWSETHVSSTGGGGYVHPTQGGHVSAPQVYSTVRERQSYFIKVNGKEIEVRDSVPARKEHIIRIIYGYPYPDTKENNEILAMKNVTTSDYRREKLLQKKYLDGYLSLSESMPIPSNLKSNFLFRSTKLLILFAIFAMFIPFVGWIISLIIIYLLIKGNSERKKRVIQLNGDIDSFIKKIGPA